MPLPTPAQTQAIQTEGRPVLVEAGAGTGKTWVLVQRFLHLLDAHPEWPLESIIAVTFTEKAAREMRTRLRQAVDGAAFQAPPGSHWHIRRRDLDHLQVGTLHGLCARLLHEHALAAGLDPHFTVLDELEAELLKEDALSLALRELAGAQEATGGLELLAWLRVRDLHAQLGALLTQRGSVHRLFQDLPAPAVLLEGWLEALRAARQEAWEGRLRAQAGLAECVRALPHLPLPPGDDKLTPTVLRAQEGCRAAMSGDLASACAAWLSINLSGGKAASWGGSDSLKDLKDDLKTLRAAARALQEVGLDKDPGPLDVQAAQALQSWRDLWERVSGAYETLKAGRQAEGAASLDFDDLELRAEELLTRPDPGPRLRAYLAGLRHLMVDEFQDTNLAQSRIVAALASPWDGGRLFVVGDAKQSIYRFRQAQVAVFRRMAQEITAAAGAEPVRLDLSFRSSPPLVNALNALFDVLLRPLGGNSAHAPFEAPPGPLAAAPLAPAGFPGVSPSPAAPPQFLIPNSPLFPPVELWILPSADASGHALSADDSRVFEARLLADRLLRLEAERFPVWDPSARRIRPFRFDDAAILFRAATSLPLYEEQFKAAGLPYLTVSGRGYFDRPEVQDLTALLSALYNPADDLSLATALRSPLFSLSDETLYRLRWQIPGLLPGEPPEPAAEPRPYRQALLTPPPLPTQLSGTPQSSGPPLPSQARQVEFAGRVLEELWRLAGRVDVWRLLRRALDLTGYEAVLACLDQDGLGGGRQWNNVQKLLELARAQPGAGLAGFLRRVQDLRTREAREGEALGRPPASGAVTLLTIHSAKGLEFPVVAVADLGRSLRHAGEPPRLLFDPAFGLVCMLRDPQGRWVKPASYRWGESQAQQMEAAESKRLLYVACTRAAGLLLLSGRPGRQPAWIDEILAAWEVPAEGPAAETLARDGFSLAVFRPAV